MIVAVSGGKGGVGKSTMALNLGAELDAVVVDGDLAMADIPHGRGPDLHDVLTGRADPIEAVRTIEGTRVLPCGRSLAGARAADLGRFEDIIDTVEREFGRVVIDCPAGLASDVGVQLHVSDLVVLVTTDTDEAITDALRTKRLALEVEAPIGAVVLNRATVGVDRKRAIERALGAPVTVVPSAQVVHEARANGLPVRETDSGSIATERIQRLAETVSRCEPK
ncbi:chromosome partitioning protein ParA [Halostagnicola larsenii XH-48]|uniref:Chromosome partitioning protein ParA n=1 Tax=Halostagnicola larsenii XH-48 TaxID=797299 RepID=W0JN68_9EURY|nr:AAA family ATPase [Halostagnicola larsenii]AHF98422.1 chromosome partitioning protein ParA [Halostagnicola larsenii XH-48]